MKTEKFLKPRVLKPAVVKVVSKVEDAPALAPRLPEATVAMFSLQECLNCGFTQGIFTGLFQREQNYRDRSFRWSAIKPHEVNPNLPLERKEMIEKSIMCMVCADSLGFVLPGENVKVQVPAPPPHPPTELDDELFQSFYKQSEI